MAQFDQVFDATAAPEPKPGLREETLHEMRKKRHAYPHEVVALVDEVLELRAKLNTPRSALESYFPFPGNYGHINDQHREAAQRLAELLERAFEWSYSRQGRDYWFDVHDQLETIG